MTFDDNEYKRHHPNTEDLSLQLEKRSANQEY